MRRAGGESCELVWSHFLVLFPRGQQKRTDGHSRTVGFCHHPPYRHPPHRTYPPTMMARRAHITNHHGIIARCIIVAAADTPSLSVLSSVCLLYDY